MIEWHLLTNLKGLNMLKRKLYTVSLNKMKQYFFKNKLSFAEVKNDLCTKIFYKGYLLYFFNNK